jgi:hypothetical protein
MSLQERQRAGEPPKKYPHWTSSRASYVGFTLMWCFADTSQPVRRTPLSADNMIRGCSLLDPERASSGKVAKV